MKKRAPRRAHLDRANCDNRVRKLIHARGACERCGTTYGPFEHAHIIRRRYAWTRTDERNGWCLCHFCHQTVDTQVSQFNDLVEKTIGWELYLELEEKANRREKFAWDDELVRLKALQAEQAT